MKKIILLIVFILLQNLYSNAQLVTTFAGSSAGYIDATGLNAQFDNPQGIATDASGNVYVADFGNNKIRKITPAGVVSTFAGSTLGSANGTGTAAQFNGPMGVATDASGNVYVADSGNHRIRKITSAGVVTTFAGAAAGFSDTPGFVRFNSPQDVTTDASGNVYVADYNNHRIRKITSAGVVSTLAGSTAGFADATGAAAQFDGPAGVSVDASGNVFVGDTGNSKIRKITPAGVVTTFRASVPSAQRVLVDASNNVYVTSNNDHQVFKINASGVGGSSLGTTNFGGTDGYGTQVRFYLPIGMAKNAAGDIYICDSGYNRIRKILIAPVKPFISAVSEVPTCFNSTINYTIGANTTPTTTVINYGLSATALTSQVTGFSLNTPDSVAGQVLIPNLAQNTTYFYQIVATNSLGSTSSAVDSFTTKTLIEYNFNTTYNNVLGNSPFSSSAQTAFVQDRNAVANQALSYTTSGSSTATITNLPIGNTARTVSVWFKIPSASPFGANIFRYGNINNAFECFGLSLGSSGEPIVNLGGNNNYNYGGTVVVNSWRHLVVTYDQTNIRVYSNGTLLNTAPASLNTALTGMLLAGSGYITTVDDLQIYNYALSQTEVTNLYNNNTTLATSNFNKNNLQVAVYPNPANNILNVEAATDLKSIEIYNIQGQKVKTSNQKQINVADLSAGMYMIKVEDIENAIATKKFVKQ